MGPAPLGRGLAVVEELVDAGEHCDTHDPARRRLMAETLAWHLELTRTQPCRPALADGWSMYASDRLWPRQAHAPIFDFEATSDGAEWIDAIAARAKSLATGCGEDVVGHRDWSGKHFRFAEGQVAVVYDWDSLGLCPEAVIVGGAAMTFTANFDLPGVGLAPTPDEACAFVDAYAATRGEPFAHRDRRRIAACATFTLAYAARCENCRVDGRNATEDPNSFTWALATYGERYLDA